MKKISNTSVKKHAASIHCSGQLSLVQRKMFNILLSNAYYELLTKDIHSIPIKSMCLLLGWEDSNNMDGLKDTLKALISTIIEFNLIGDNGEIWQAMSLLNSASLSKGVCNYSYSKELANRFYQPEIFAVINIGIQRNFSSNYALTLYENCVRFIKVGSTGWWDLKTFRLIMGATSETYDEFKRLSAFVIKKAVEEVNLVSDIKLIVEYKREQRKVVSIRFLISSNPMYSMEKIDVNSPQVDSTMQIMESELFKKLRSHGIGEKLAINWIMDDLELAQKAVNYTEAQDEKGVIRGSKAGYIRRLIEEKAKIGESDYEKNVNKNKQKLIEQSIKQKSIDTENKFQKDYQQVRFQQVYNALSKKQLIDLKDQFLISESAKSITYNSFDDEKGKFIDKITQLTFLPWLKRNITPPFNEAEYLAWKALKK